MTKKSEITYGDLVHIDGYDTRCFFVDGWTVEHNYTPEATWTEKWFDVTCAHTGEYHMAEASEVTRVCGADQADDYLLQHASPPDETMSMPDIFAIGFELDFSGMNKTKEESEMNRKQERKPTQRELSSMEAERRKQARKERKEKIDVLLDEYNDYKALADEFGDEEYKARVEYISGKLAELAEEGTR